MAVRYAGDAVIRIETRGKRYHVRFTAPGLSGQGTLTARECGLSQMATSPEAYDKVAQRVVAFLRVKGVRVGALRRVFQAPCPIPVR